MRKRRLLGGRGGFTLLEIMIAVFVIGILAAIAVPSFLQSKNTAKKNLCINNLKLLFLAKEQFTFDAMALETTVPTTDDIAPYVRNGIIPVCPLGGVAYDLNAVSDKPTCPTFSTSGHVLP